MPEIRFPVEGFQVLGTERNGLDQAAVYIILLNWNSAADTLRCLRALTLLRGVQARVMVVDNGSEPADLERLRSGIARWGLAVELVETGENLGFGGGCNVGMRLTLERGAEFVWLLNNDAVPHPDALQAMLRVMERDGEVAAVGSVIYDLERPERVQTWGGGWIWRWAGVARHHRRPVAARRLDYLTAASILLRREALERAGLFDEDTFFMYWEDTDLCFRLRAQGWKLAVAGDAVIWHQRSSSLGHANPLKDYYVTASSRRFLWRNVRAIVSALWDRSYGLSMSPSMDVGAGFGAATGRPFSYSCCVKSATRLGYGRMCGDCWKRTWRSKAPTIKGCPVPKAPARTMRAAVRRADDTCLLIIHTAYYRIRRFAVY